MLPNLSVLTLHGIDTDAGKRQRGDDDGGLKRSRPIEPGVEFEFKAFPTYANTMCVLMANHMNRPGGHVQDVINAFDLQDRGPLTFSTNFGAGRRFDSTFALSDMTLSISLLNMAIVFEDDQTLKHLLSTEGQHLFSYENYAVQQSALEILAGWNVSFPTLGADAYKRMRNQSVFKYLLMYARQSSDLYKRVRNEGSGSGSVTQIEEQDLWLARYKAISLPVRRLADDRDEQRNGFLSPLMLAVAQGNVKAVSALLDKSTSGIHERRSYQTPLITKNEDVFDILKRAKEKNNPTSFTLFPVRYRWGTAAYMLQQRYEEIETLLNNKKNGDILSMVGGALPPKMIKPVWPKMF